MDPGDEQRDDSRVLLRRTPMKTTNRLKQIVARRAAVQAPGTANALFARVIEELGFEVVYVTGAGIANMHLGAPDIGLTTLTEITDAVAAIADAVALPLIVDADTGFGNAVNMVRTVRVLERAGAAGLQIKAPHVANIVFGGKTPDPGQVELAKMGFSLVLYANAALQAAVKAAMDVLGVLKRDGSLDGVREQLVSFEERQRIVKKPAWDAFESKYQAASGKGAA